MSNKKGKRKTSKDKSKKGVKRTVKIARSIQGCLLLFDRVSIEKLAVLMDAGLNLDNIKPADMPVFLPLAAELLVDSARGSGPYAPNVLAGSFDEWAVENLPDKYTIMNEIILETHGESVKIKDLTPEQLNELMVTLDAHMLENRPDNTVFVRDIPIKKLTSLLTELMSVGGETGKG